KADEIARILSRQLRPASKNPLKDTLGAVDQVVAMTDRVIEIRLTAPRPNLLAILAQPEFAIVRLASGTGPFTLEAKKEADGALVLTRTLGAGDESDERLEHIYLKGVAAERAIAAFAAGEADLVLGGRFADLPLTRRVKLERGALRFDPASGLFGLVPTRTEGVFAKPEVRDLLSRAIDRDAFATALGVPGLIPRATLLEPGLDGIAPPVAPAWYAVPVAERRAALFRQAGALFGDGERPTVRVGLPNGPGGDLLLRQLAADWGALGLRVERSASPSAADFVLVDEVAPSLSAAWFVRRFRCGIAAVCDQDADKLIDAARGAQVSAQRYALIAQAAGLIDTKSLFIPLIAPVRWSLVADSITGFRGNRFAHHTLGGLQDAQTGRE
ncbi:MAG: ABC transporter substrate-binding protein, partial [Sphingomicrobium sp.]